MKLSILLNRGADSNYEHGNLSCKERVLQLACILIDPKPKYCCLCVHVADAEPSDAAAAARRRQQRSLVDARRGYPTEALAYMLYFYRVSL